MCINVKPCNSIIHIINTLLFLIFSCFHTLWSNWSGIVIILHLISTTLHCHSFDYFCWSKFPITKTLISLLLILVQDLFIGSTTLSEFIQTHSKVQKRQISLQRQLNGKLLERVHSISLKVVDCIEQWCHVPHASDRRRGRDY